MKELLRGTKHKILRWLKVRNRMGLKNKKFTILANNCGGGYVYQYYGIEYNTPTAGLLFNSEDFLKICKNPKRYLTEEPKIIEIDECLHSLSLSKTEKWGAYPVGRIDDVEIYFMHYSTQEEALSKWLRRCKRISYDNMILMLLENETCNEKIIREFCELDFPNKICLTYNKYDIPGTIYSQEVHDSEDHSWKPEIVISIVDWKVYLNSLI